MLKTIELIITAILQTEIIQRIYQHHTKQPYMQEIDKKNQTLYKELEKEKQKNDNLPRQNLLNIKIKENNSHIIRERLTLNIIIAPIIILALRIIQQRHAQTTMNLTPEMSINWITIYLATIILTIIIKHQYKKTKTINTKKTKKRLTQKTNNQNKTGKRRKKKI